MSTVVTSLLLFPTKLQWITWNASVSGGILLETAKLPLIDIVSFCFPISHGSCPTNLTSQCVISFQSFAEPPKHCLLGKISKLHLCIK